MAERELTGEVSPDDVALLLSDELGSLRTFRWVGRVHFASDDVLRILCLSGDALAAVADGEKGLVSVRLKNCASVRVAVVNLAGARSLARMAAQPRAGEFLTWAEDIAARPFYGGDIDV